MAVAVGVAAPVGLHENLALAAAPADSGKDLEAARKLYDEGKSFFDTSQYEKAADMWTIAYGKVPDDAPGVKNAMVYNIATAQEKAFLMDKDLVHLRQAEQLLRTYVENHKRLYKKTPKTKAEVDKANARIRELQREIAAAERGDAPTPPPFVARPVDAHYGSGAVDGIQWNTGSTAEVDQAAVEANQRLSRESQKTDAMIIAGYVTGSIGLVALLVGFGGLGGAAAAEDAAPGQRTGRGVGYVGLGVGLAGVATGATLLGVGFSRRKKIRERQLRVAPSVGRRSASLSFGMRF